MRRIFNKKLIKRLVIGLLLLLITAFLGEYIWSTYQLKKHTGELTKIIDPTPFFDSYQRIGIKNVNILSANGEYFQTKNIVLNKGKIESILNVDSLNNGVKYIDGSEKYLISGLTDTHVHLLNSKNDLYLNLANGVTSIAEMFGTEKHLKWKNESKKGEISPKIFVASSKLGSQKGFNAKMSKNYGGVIHLQDAESSRKTIKNFKEKGYDAIKLGTFMYDDIFDIIIQESKSKKIPVIGHLSIDKTLTDFYGSGQSQLAHIEEITKATMREFGGINSKNAKEYISYLENNIEEIALNLKKYNISVSTTIWLMESLPKQKFDLENFVKSIELEYVNPGILEGSGLNKGWLPGNNEYEITFETDEELEKSKIFWTTYVEAIHIVTKALSENDVTLLVGTDSNVAGVVSGFSMHYEMESLSKLGISNADVLKYATETPASFINFNTGKIQVGYDADLVLLSKNPIESIKNTREIETVFFGNYTITKEQIKRLLSEIVRINNAERNTAINKHLE
ncbi:MAG: amidohydrolase family protein [Saonia sp.]